ncbi:MAG: hypothetical protein ACJ780_28130 [Solirubrobacteraceae bacterium]
MNDLGLIVVEGQPLGVSPRGDPGFDLARVLPGVVDAVTGFNAFKTPRHAGRTQRGLTRAEPDRRKQAVGSYVIVNPSLLARPGARP